MTRSLLHSACIAALFSATSAASATQFQVTLPTTQTSPVSGRLLVFAKAIEAGKPLPESVDTASYEPPGSVTVAAQEVPAWAPGHTITLDGDGASYATAFKDLPPGRYAVQVVPDRDHSYAGNGRGAGDLVSPVVAMALPQGDAVALTENLPPADPWELPAAAPAQVLADTAAVPASNNA